MLDFDETEFLAYTNLITCDGNPGKAYLVLNGLRFDPDDIDDRDFLGQANDAAFTEIARLRDFLNTLLEESA